MAPIKVFCPSELAASLDLIYEQYSPKDRSEDGVALRARLKSELGWELFGPFTCYYMRFLGLLRTVGHRRITDPDLGEILRKVVPKTCAKKRKLIDPLVESFVVETPETIRTKIWQLIEREIVFYRAETLKKFAEHPKRRSLKIHLMKNDWEKVISWLIRVRERKQLARLMEMVPAFELGFWH